MCIHCSPSAADIVINEPVRTVHGETARVDAFEAPFDDTGPSLFRGANRSTDPRSSAGRVGRDAIARPLETLDFASVAGAGFILRNGVDMGAESRAAM